MGCQCNLLLDPLGVEFLRPAACELEFLNMLTTFHRNALDSTVGRWLGPFGVHQVTVPHPPLGKDKGRGRTGGGECMRHPIKAYLVDVSRYVVFTERIGGGGPQTYSVMRFCGQGDVPNIKTARTLVFDLPYISARKSPLPPWPGLHSGAVKCQKSGWVFQEKRCAPRFKP